LLIQQLQTNLADKIINTENLGNGHTCHNVKDVQDCQKKINCPSHRCPGEDFAGKK
jgi:hypothetical protein